MNNNDNNNNSITKSTHKSSPTILKIILILSVILLLAAILLAIFKPWEQEEGEPVITQPEYASYYEEALKLSDEKSTNEIIEWFTGQIQQKLSDGNTEVATEIIKARTDYLVDINQNPMAISLLQEEDLSKFTDKERAILYNIGATLSYGVDEEKYNYFSEQSEKYTKPNQGVGG